MLSGVLPQQAAKLMDQTMREGAKEMAAIIKEHTPQGMARRAGSSGNGLFDKFDQATNTLMKLNRRVGKGSTRNLRDSIKVRRRKGPANEIVFHVVAEAYYAHMVEKGHALVKRKPRRIGPKYVLDTRVDPKPFMRPSFDSQGQRILTVMLSKLQKGIVKTVKQNQKWDAIGDAFGDVASNISMINEANEASSRREFSDFMGNFS